MSKLEIIATKVDPCTFVSVRACDKTYIIIYVDDGLIVSENKSRICEILKTLGRELEIKEFDLRGYKHLEFSKNRFFLLHFRNVYIFKNILRKFQVDPTNILEVIRSAITPRRV